MRRFKQCKILVATDVAAWANVEDLAHVINYIFLMMMKFMYAEAVEQEEQVGMVFL